MKILDYEFTGAGMQRVYENEKWTVGIKNWKPANDITGITNIERHNKTDELFVLVEGKCTLIYAEEKGEDLEFHAVKMEKGKLYVIPQSLWHNTITVKDTKMFLIEDVSTSNDNSDVRELTPEQIKTVQELAK
ncbi:MAG: cupin domain-containing protein [Lachnospira sp.]|jgi:mannose-6-phosphate isomerase-like protein (cupin superfamily)|nr:cupin domain-containing protein [Lachnospira sp.]